MNDMLIVNLILNFCSYGNLSYVTYFCDTPIDIQTFIHNDSSNVKNTCCLDLNKSSGIIPCNSPEQIKYLYDNINLYIPKLKSQYININVTKNKFF